MLFLFKTLAYVQHTASRPSRIVLLRAFFASLMLLSYHAGHAGEVTIESWRTDDLEVWNKNIIPAFNQRHPDIHVSFAPSRDVEYDATLKQKLRDKKAGDLITCRPFDQGLELFKLGHLLALQDSPVNLQTFRNVTKVAWSSDNGKEVFCLPVAVVTHGFFYNKKIFDELKISPPATQAEFFAMLEKIKQSNKITPIAFGSKDKWPSAQILLSIIGPNIWHGEHGRRALLMGQLKLTDRPFLDTWKIIRQLKPFLNKNSDQFTHEQARNQFIQGKAAIFPSGSWDIRYLEKMAPNQFGVFMFPVEKKEDQCYVTNHIDIGIGINSASKNTKDAQTLLNWMSTKEFSDLYANNMTGFYPLASFPITLKSDMAIEMHHWRRMCKSTIRLNSQFLNRGPELLETVLWDVSTKVLNQSIQPDEAARRAQHSLDAWFYPSTN